MPVWGTSEREGAWSWTIRLGAVDASLGSLVVELEGAFGFDPAYYVTAVTDEFAPAVRRLLGAAGEASPRGAVAPAVPVRPAVD